MKQAFKYEGCAKGHVKVWGGGRKGRRRKEEGIEGVRLLGLSRGPDCTSWGLLAEGSPCKGLEAGESGHLWAPQILVGLELESQGYTAGKNALSPCLRWDGAEGRPLFLTSRNTSG